MTRKIFLAALCALGLAGCNDTKPVNPAPSTGPSTSNMDRDKAADHDKMADRDRMADRDKMADRDRVSDPGKTVDRDTTTTDRVKVTSRGKSVDRDNTGVNVRDRDSIAKTPFDQRENQSDIDITAKIRKNVVGSDMSTDAKNVKIITENGKVTLRGPVKSAEEKTQIEKAAVGIAGEGRVDNQLEVAGSR